MTDNTLAESIMERLSQRNVSDQEIAELLYYIKPYHILYYIVKIITPLKGYIK